MVSFTSGGVQVDNDSIKINSNGQIYSGGRLSVNYTSSTNQGDVVETIDDTEYTTNNTANTEYLNFISDVDLSGVVLGFEAKNQNGTAGYHVLKVNGTATHTYYISPQQTSYTFYTFNAVDLALNDVVSVEHNTQNASFTTYSKNLRIHGTALTFTFLANPTSIKRA